MKKKQKQHSDGPTLFDYLNSISFTKEDLSVTDPNFEKTYDIFMINRFLSMSQETVFWAYEMDKMKDLPKVLHYRFLLKAIPNKRRFFKYEKGASTKNTKLINIVETYYNVGKEKALELVELLNKKQIKDLTALYEVTQERMKL